MSTIALEEAVETPADKSVKPGKISLGKRLFSKVSPKWQRRILACAGIYTVASIACDFLVIPATTMCTTAVIGG